MEHHYLCDDDEMNDLEELDFTAGNVDGVTNQSEVCGICGTFGIGVLGARCETMQPAQMLSALKTIIVIIAKANDK